LAPDRPFYFISDLHLGDGSPQDAFAGKDALLLEFLARVREEGARLVICGDAIDFPQAWNITRVLRAHGPLLRALSELADSNGVVYIWGNHDYDISLFTALFRWEVCSQLWIGPDVVVQHGHEFDPYIGPNLHSSGWATHAHHLVERVLGTWIRQPLHEFYTVGNRVAFWSFHKAWVLGMLANRLFRAVGWKAPAERGERFANYWVRSESGDPMCMLRPALAEGHALGAHALVAGHAHMPGIVVDGGLKYINTGTWTFKSATVTHFDGSQFEVRDFQTGRVYGQELYQRALDGDLDHVDVARWWQSQYLGWFRFRSGELRRATAPGR
jgi:UDP-2,3-diacylglucosamine pyrophosphatase LpxH